MFESETRAVDRAADVFVAERKKLFRGDGTPLYVDVVHRERLEELTARLDGALGAADQVATEASRKAASVLDDVEIDHRATAMDRLSEADLTRANTRARFVEEDATHLNPGELAHRARQALESGDRAMGFLLARYGGIRFERESAAGHGKNAGVMELGNAVYALWDTFKDPKAPERRREAQETRQAVSALWKHIRAKRNEVTGTDPTMDAARRRVGAHL